MIEALRSAEPQTLLNVGGFVIGILFGYVAEATAFCLRSAVREALDRSKVSPRPRTIEFLAATVAALVFTQALVAAFQIDLSKSIYWSVPVNILALIIGGIVFGMGMVLANGCPGRHLVLVATGSIRSLLVLTVLGLAGYATLRGALAYPRIGLEATGLKSGIPQGLHQVVGLSAPLATVILVAAGVATIVALARGTAMMRVLRPVATGALVGAIVAFGWFVTGYLAANDFEAPRPASLSFTAPVAETVMYLLITTGDTLKFSVTLVAGVLLGAATSAVVGRRFAVRGFASELAPLRYGGGAVLMGFGAVLALGCSIGQGVTGISTLATGSFIATVSIVTGAVLMSLLDERLASGTTTVASHGPEDVGGLP